MTTTMYATAATELEQHANGVREMLLAAQRCENWLAGLVDEWDTMTDAERKDAAEKALDRLRNP